MRTCGEEQTPRSVALPVLGGGETGGRPRKIRASRAGRWRAGVLIGVHVLIAAHIGLWMAMGRTVSPVEPSESMYTIERGVVNAGAVFFLLAILSTLIFGRFFCGWGCHVVALQDLCHWSLKKVKIHPKPFRTRLLVLAPLLVAFYMFGWATVRREVVAPLVGAELWPSVSPWLGEAGHRPEGFETELIVEDFWATFAPWYIAIPFLGVCGFAVVYFLGSKGFCTYGCPYGAFFAPSDRLAPGRILVNEDCHQCGHCTAVCTSNVRVHEEVRDYGMVVDSGCMKCLDCVSVCPNGALRFGLALPPLLNPRVRRAKRGARPKRNYDLTLGQEVWIGAIGVGLFFAFRGMFDHVPLLMAVGLAAIGAFGGWKLYSLVRVPNVRLQNLQLKFKGRLTRAGVAFMAAGVCFFAAAGWSGLVKYHLWRGDVLHAGVRVPVEAVLSPGYVPDPGVRERAERAVWHYTRASAPSEGGLGWPRSQKLDMRLAYLSAVSGDRAAAEGHLVRAMERQMPSETSVRDLVTMMVLRGATPVEVAGAMERIVKRFPEAHAARLTLAGAQLQLGMAGAAVEGARYVLGHAGDHLPMRLGAAELLLHAGRADLAAAALADAEARWPREASIQGMLGTVAVVSGDAEEALSRLRGASQLEPSNPLWPARIAEVLAALGRQAEAQRYMEAANRLASEPPK